MLKMKSFLIISAVALLGLLLFGCSTDTPNGRIIYDHVAMPEETDPYYMIGFSDYVFIGSTLSDGNSITLPSGNKRLEYDISVRECLKGNLEKEIKAVYPAYFENDGTLVLMEGDFIKDDGLPEKGKNYIFVGSAQPDGRILLESLYAKTEYNDDNYQKFIDYVANETIVDRERFISSFEIDPERYEETFRTVIDRLIPELGMKLAGAVCDFTEPATGQNKLFFPVE